MQEATGSFLAQHTRLSCRRTQPQESRCLAGFCRRLSRGAWLFSSCCRSFARFECGFNHRRQFQLRLFRIAMAAMTQRPDVRGFRLHTQLSVSIFFPLVLKVCRDRFGCHGQSVAELDPSQLCNFGHSLTIYGLPRRGGWLGERWSAKHQRSASSGWVKARCCLGSEGHERFDWSRSLLEQSAEMSNFVQPHDVGDTNIHACLARPPDKDGQPLGASMSSCRRVGISRRAT